jgi:ATP-binding cassette subfamily B protein
LASYELGGDERFLSEARETTPASDRVRSRRSRKPGYRLEVRSRTTGRIRWHLEPISAKRGLGRALEAALSELEGIQRVTANPLTGSLLVQFEPVISVGAIRRVIVDVVEAEAAVVPSPASAATMTDDESEFDGLLERASKTLGKFARVLLRRAAPELDARVDWEVLSRLVRPHRAEIGAAFALTVLSGAANTLRLLAVGAAVTSVAGSALALGSPLAIAGVAVGANVVYLLASRSARRRWSVVGYDIHDELRRHLYDHVQRVELRYHHGPSGGDMLAHLTADMNQVERAIDSSWQLLRTGTHSLIGAVGLLIAAPGLIWLSLIPLPAVVWLSIRYQPALRRSYAAISEKLSSLNVRVASNLNGISTIRAFAAEDREAVQVAAASAEYRIKSQEAAGLNFGFTYLLEGALLAGVVGTNWLGAHLMSSGKLSVGGHTGVVMVVGNMLFLFPYLGEILEDVQRGMTSLGRIGGVLRLPTETDGGATELDLTDLRGDILYEDVSLSYAGAADVLKELNVHFRAGRTTGVTGLSGSGKSSLINLLLRFYEPRRGRIMLDGVDIASLRRADLRRAIAVVSQDVFLFNDTILENIRFGKPDATLEQVHAAAEAAAAHDFITRLPAGYASVVGERGVLLSGGQRQRIAIARALVYDAPVLVFDEATSSLDFETEAIIHRTLSRRLAGKTVVLIAHRLSTVQNADYIYVLDDGVVVQNGTHEQLLAIDGRYRSLWGEAARGATNELPLGYPKLAWTRESGGSMPGTSRDDFGADKVELEGTRPDHPPTAELVGASNGEANTQVSFVLPRRPGAEPALVRAAQARAELSQEQLEALSAPNESDVATITSFFDGQPLRVVGISKIRREIVVEGSRSAIDRLLGIETKEYRQGQRRYRSRSGNIRLPHAIHHAVEHVAGLPEPPARRDVLHRVGKRSDRAYLPTEVAAHYRFPKEVDGRGQRIAVIELGGGFYESDVAAYLRLLQLPQPELRVISVDGATNQPLDKATLQAIMADLNAGMPKEAVAKKYAEQFQDFADTIETTMDIELVAAFAPGAHIDVYFAPWDGLDGLRKALYAALGQGPDGHSSTAELPVAISVSWGSAECKLDPKILQGIDDALRLACILGVTVCCASGDYGSVDFSAGTSPNHSANADFPGTSPWALACGGTTLELEPPQSSERVWNSMYSGSRMATGGGMSGVLPRPEYQRNLDTPAVGNTWRSADCPGLSGRWLPDVASSADPNRAYSIILGGEPFTGFGTSAAAPLWTAIAAIASKVLGRRLGWLQPWLYGSQRREGFFEIADGDNRVSDDPEIPFYSAAPGWDPCTGFGSPNVEALINALKRS